MVRDRIASRPLGASQLQHVQAANGRDGTGEVMLNFTGEISAGEKYG